MYEPPKIAEVIKKRAKSKGIQLKDMLLDLHLNKNTLSNMYNGSMLKGDSLARIADYLDCSVDDLLGRADADTKKEKPTVKDDELSDEEQELLNLYRSASPEMKKIMRRLLNDE